MLDLAPYVDQRGRALWRAAWLLTGDPGHAEELLRDALGRAWPRTVAPGGDVEPVVAGALVAAYTSWRGRRWRRGTDEPVEDPDALVRSVLGTPEPAPDDPLVADVPPPPDLAALADGARRRTRAVRAAKALGAVAVFATAATVVPLAPGWVDRAGTSASGPSSVVEVSTECRLRSEGGLDHEDFLLGEAAWARFCVVGGSYPRRIGSAVIPDAVLVDDVATVVRGWQRTGPRSGPCPGTTSATKFAVQVGFDDGTVAEVYGETSTCPAFTRPGGARVVPGGQVHRELLTALAVQESAGLAPPLTGADDLACPAAPAELPTSVAEDPASDLATASVATAVLCTYDPAADGAAPARTELRPTEAERVRALALGAFDPDPPACGRDRPGPAYLVLLAARGGAVHEVALDAGECAAYRVDDLRLGSSPALAAALTSLGSVTER